MDLGRRLLLVHAHPDDETINNGATMARYAAEGARVTLLTATLGEFGEILVPALAELEAERGDQLGGYRMLELERALGALGVDDHRFLGGAGRFHDSGMMGTAANAHPRAFWRAATDPEVFAAAVRAAVDVIRDVRPQVVVTYDENGGYGHPDHIMAHRVTLAAVDAAADPDYSGRVGADGAGTGPDQPWAVSKVYRNVLPRFALQRGLDALRGSDAAFERVDSLDELPFVAEDDEVSTAIDARAHLNAKRAALAAHATQVAVDGEFFALSNHIGMAISGIEYYGLLRGAAGVVRDDDGFETDLFAGLG